HQEQRNTDTDHGDCVKQAGHQEHTAGKHGRHFRLPGNTFEKFTTEDTETDGGTECAKANQQAHGHCGQTNNEFHICSPRDVLALTIEGHENPRLTNVPSRAPWPDTRSTTS